ncbi:TolC family protein [Paraflavitalea sp. CAU 1676]|uniref:TolC family protein n=1 Tax=Paraflavitalea sp. CAU 1676 TaxID=3032598 RepID=UPI0023DC73E6|nr:TolC family protein [Paraflavitalea sp. CAU 1676]MDF2187729.1 TolC family protein [Paraflavitalea sp. CAU 1676]
MMKRLSWSLLLIAGLTGGRALAQDTAPAAAPGTLIPAGSVTTLELKDALNYVLKASYAARQAKLDIENGQYQIEEVKSRALPQITGNANITYNPILQQSALPGELAGQPGKTLLVAFGQKWSSGAGISVSQSLFDQGVFTGLKAAKSTQEYYRIAAQYTDEQLIEQVATLYYRVLVQRQMIGVIDTTLMNTIKVQKIIKGQYENGLAKQIDVDRITVNVSNLQSQRQQLLNAVSQLENQLKYAMGMSIETHIALPAVAFEAIHPQAVSIADTMNFSNRTEYKLLKQQETLLKLQKDAYKAEYYPTLSLNGNYAYQGLGNKLPWFQKAGVNWFDYSAVSVNLRVPIFNGFATRSRIRQADVSIRKLQEDIQNTSLGLNMNYHNAKTQINSSVIVLNTQKENVALAQKVFFNVQNNYNNGLASLTDLLDAETSLTEAHNSYSSALLDYRVAEIQLIKAQGNLKSLLN